LRSDLGTSDAELSHFIQTQRISLLYQGYEIFGATGEGTREGNKGWFAVFSYILNTAIFPRFSAFFYKDDVQDGDTFGFSSTRVTQTINYVCYCPDQDTG
jgi:hypothetical protein